MSAKIHSLNISKTKGVAKQATDSCRLIEGFGFTGDAHAGDSIRQVSLLALESIVAQRSCPKVKSAGLNLAAGDFAENITTSGLDLKKLKIGQRLSIAGAILEISKIGKECHNYCAIYYKTGDCIMPREGIFAKVIAGGMLKVGDAIEVDND